jgi:hypothetical protein
MIMGKLAVLLSVWFLVSCGSSGIDPLKKATLDGSTTIETLFNTMAGPNGSVSWYKPAEQPANNNFKNIGAKVKNGEKQIDMVLSVDTSDMTAVIEAVTSNGKTVHYNQFGIPDDMDAFIDIVTEWAGLGGL